MKTVFCRCRQCRGARKQRRNQAQIKRAQRHVRNAVRVNLARGDYEHLPTVAAAGYLA